MGIIAFKPSELLADMPATTPVKDALSAVPPKVASRAFNGAAASRAGTWVATPGEWRRYVMQAEFCYFFAGRATFTPDGGEAIEITAGDALYFPANSNGIWKVEETLTKTFVVFDEA